MNFVDPETDSSPGCIQLLLCCFVPGLHAGQLYSKLYDEKWVVLDMGLLGLIIAVVLTFVSYLAASYTSVDFATRISNKEVMKAHWSTSLFCLIGVTGAVLRFRFSNSFIGKAYRESALMSCLKGYCCPNLTFIQELNIVKVKEYRASVPLQARMNI